MITLELRLLDGELWVPADSVLTDGAVPRLGASALSVVVDGTEYVGDRWNLGHVERIVAQADDCVRRLRADAPAILRSGVLDREHVPFFLFEPPPRPGGRASISQFFIDDPDVEQWSPLPGWGLRDPERLFDWVAEHRHDLLAAAADEAREANRPVLFELAVPPDQLVEQLELLVESGRALLDRAGERDSPA